MRLGWFVVSGLFLCVNCSKPNDTPFSRLIQMLPPQAQVTALADVNAVRQMAAQLSKQMEKIPVVAQNPAVLQKLLQMKDKSLEALSDFWSPVGLDWQRDLHWAALGLVLSKEHQPQRLLAVRGRFPASIEQQLASVKKPEPKLGHAVYVLDPVQDLVLIRLDSEHLVVGQSELAMLALTRWVDGVKPDQLVHQRLQRPTQAGFRLRLAMANVPSLVRALASPPLPRLQTLEQISTVVLDLSAGFELQVFCSEEQRLSDVQLLLESLEQIALSAVVLTQAWSYLLLASDIEVLAELPQPVQQVFMNRSSLVSTLSLLDPKTSVSRISPLPHSVPALRLQGDMQMLLQWGMLASWIWLMPDMIASFMAN